MFISFQFIPIYFPVYILKTDMKSKQKSVRLFKCLQSNEDWEGLSSLSNNIKGN